MKTKNQSFQNKTENITTVSFFSILTITLICLLVAFISISKGADRIDSTEYHIITKAEENQQEGKYKSALTTYNHLIRKNNNNKDALYQRAECKKQLGKYQLAINDYVKYIKITGDSLTGLKQIALTILKAGNDPFEVIEVCDMALAKNRDDADVIYYKGVAQYEAGMYEDAKYTLLNAIDMKSDRVDAYKYLGLVYGAMKQYNKAIATTEKIIAINNNDAGAYYNLGLFYNHLSDYHHAYMNINNAVELGYKVDQKIYKKLYRKQKKQ